MKNSSESKVLLAALAAFDAVAGAVLRALRALRALDAVVPVEVLLDGREDVGGVPEGAGDLLGDEAVAAHAALEAEVVAAGAACEAGLVADASLLVGVGLYW